MLYFDYCATAPPFPEVADSVRDAMLQFYGNPSSIHGIGLKADNLLQEARRSIAKLLDASAESVVFTSGGTEGNNLALRGAAWAYANRGKHIITSAIEHASVSEPLEDLKGHGFEITVLPVDGAGRVDPERVRSALRPDTILVSIMHINNEVGAIQPIEEITATVKAESKALVHVDAVQSVAKIPVSFRRLGVDLLSMSGHKFKGPRGIGALLVKPGVRLVPQLAGGGQEQGLRSTTENVPGAAGMAKALRLSLDRMEREPNLLHSYRRSIISCVESLPELVLNSPSDDSIAAPHLVNVSFPGMKPEAIVHALEQEGVAVSTRSACASGEEKPSRILLAMGADRQRAASGIRISFSHDHTPDDIRVLCAALTRVVKAHTSMVRR